MQKTVIKTLYLIAGGFFVLLGLVGVVLPLLPTTPFLLVATFCFSRSSERLHQALLNNRYVGHLIRDWEQHGVIPLKAKILATSMMIVMVSYPLIFRDFHLGLKAAASTTVVFALAFVWSRPSQPAKESTT